MDIHVHTQYCENYGTVEQPYWKFKGGSTVVLTGFSHPLNDRIGHAAQAAVNAARASIEYANPMSEEYIIDWELVDTDSLTPDEKLQMEYDGHIVHRDKRMQAAA